MSSMVRDLAEQLASLQLTPPGSEEVCKDARSVSNASLFNERKTLNSDSSSFGELPMKDDPLTTVCTSALMRNQKSELGGFSASNFQTSAAAGDAPPLKRLFQHRPRSGAKHEGPRQQKISLCETLYVPVKKYPKYNFVGRILGPRGMTVKQLEKETGCKIYVRGRASNMAFNPHTKMLRGGVICNKASLSTISQGSLTDEPLHVAIECHDYPGVAQKKMENAVAIIQDLLSPPADGKDELKRQQLVDISLINGTYRPTNASNTDRSRQTVDPTSNPVVEETSSKSGVYRIPQRRNWCKPRGPDVNTEEFAKSASSREYVMDIVNKTTQEARVVGDGQDLSQTAVNERLKIANSLLDSHQKISYGVELEENVHKPLQILAPVHIPQHTYDNRMLDNSGYYPHHPPPPPPMPQFMHQPAYHYPSPPPPPPPHFPPTNQSAVYPLPGLVYMLPDTFDNNNDYDKFLHHHHRRY